MGDAPGLAGGAGHAAVREELLAHGDMQADKAPLAAQRHDGLGRDGSAWLWYYSHPRGTGGPGKSGGLFDFRLERSRVRPRQFLAGFEGILESDRYPAY